VACDEHRQDGAFAEYVAVPQRIVYPLPEDVSFEQAAMVEPCSIAVHGVGLTRISLNDTAVVVGAGMIGLLVVQALRAAGCGKIIAVDIEPQKLDLARQLGADIVLNSSQTDVISKIEKMTDNRGADVVIEAVGITATMQNALACVRKGGALTVIGNLSPTVEIPLQLLVASEIAIYGSCASRGEYPACLDLIARGAIDVNPLISAVAPLSEGAAWFQRLYQGEKGLMKVILVP
jgi:L-iditol 2-dehydrogenase